MAGQQLYVARVAEQQLAHEVEVLGGELVAVVHELDVLFAHAALDRGRHRHLTRPVLCSTTAHHTVRRVGQAHG